MLEFQTNSGHVFYLNHLISFFLTLLYFWWLAKKMITEIDKVKHASISSFLTFIGLSILVPLNINWLIVPIFVLLIGIFKEILDKLDKNKNLFDFYDLLADILGILYICLIYVFSFLL